MTPNDFNDIVQSQIENCLYLLQGKAQEYAKDSDRLHNFRVGSTLTGLPMRQVVAGMMVKHTTSIYDLCMLPTSVTYEMWQEKITDHINYLLILAAVILEEDKFQHAQQIQDLKSALETTHA